MNASTWLLTRRTLIQFPRNPMVVGFAIPPVLMMFLVFGALFEGVKHLPGFPTDNYYEYLAPAAVLMTTVPGDVEQQHRRSRRYDGEREPPV